MQYPIQPWAAYGIGGSILFFHTTGRICLKNGSISATMNITLLIQSVHKLFWTDCSFVYFCNASLLKRSKAACVSSRLSIEKPMKKPVHSRQLHDPADLLDPVGRPLLYRIASHPRLRSFPGSPGFSTAKCLINIKSFASVKNGSFTVSFQKTIMELLEKRTNFNLFCAQIPSTCFGR